MNLTHISDQTLQSQLETLVKDERRIGVEILWHLKEVRARRLYSNLGYPSLYAYCTKGLKYSEAAAYRRISAMELLKKLPEQSQKEIATKINTGALTVTHLSMAQKTIKQAAKNPHAFLNPLSLTPPITSTTHATLNLLSHLENKSTRDAEKTLCALTGVETLPRETQRSISATHTEIKFCASDALISKLNKIKSLWSHSNPEQTYAVLFEQMADLVLDKIDPSQIQARQDSKVKNKNFSKKLSTAPQIISSPKNLRTISPAAEKLMLSTPITPKTPTRFIHKSRTPISVKLRREIWIKHQGACTRCQSRYQVQIEHKIPVAHGGQNTPENLTLLCRSCNLHAATQTLGKTHMRKFM